MASEPSTNGDNGLAEVRDQKGRFRPSNLGQPGINHKQWPAQNPGSRHITSSYGQAIQYGYDWTHHSQTSDCEDPLHCGLLGRRH
jgi:hypothetical protein